MSQRRQVRARPARGAGIGATSVVLAVLFMLLAVGLPVQAEQHEGESAAVEEEDPWGPLRFPMAGSSALAYLRKR